MSVGASLGWWALACAQRPRASAVCAAAPATLPRLGKGQLLCCGLPLVGGGPRGDLPVAALSPCSRGADSSPHRTPPAVRPAAAADAAERRVGDAPPAAHVKPEGGGAWVGVGGWVGGGGGGWGGDAGGGCGCAPTVAARVCWLPQVPTSTSRWSAWKCATLGTSGTGCPPRRRRYRAPWCSGRCAGGRGGP